MSRADEYANGMLKYVLKLAKKKYGSYENMEAVTGIPARSMRYYESGHMPSFPRFEEICRAIGRHLKVSKPDSDGGLFYFRQAFAVCLH